jgi:hypothetical protein
MAEREGFAQNLNKSDIKGLQERPLDPVGVPTRPRRLSMLAPKIAARLDSLELLPCRLRANYRSVADARITQLCTIGARSRHGRPLPFHPLIDSEMSSPAALASGKTGLVLCQVGDQ